MDADTLELVFRVCAYVTDPPQDRSAKRLVKLASQIIDDYIQDEPPFDCECDVCRCTDRRPCCDRRLMPSRKIDGRTIFDCPKRCVCHE